MMFLVVKADPVHPDEPSEGKSGKRNLLGAPFACFDLTVGFRTHF